MTTFYNFTLKIETSWAKKLFFGETWNANDVIVHVWKDSLALPDTNQSVM